MSVLPKIAAALTKHLSPVSSSTATHPDGKKARPGLKVVPRPERQPREEDRRPPPEGFQRFEAPEAPREASPAESPAPAPAPTPLPRVATGVAATLIDLLDRIRITGAQLTRRKALRSYDTANENKTENSKFKKGSMLDTEGG